MAGAFSTPRPIPSQTPALLAGAAVVGLALPVFVAAGWPLAGWLVGAVLWAASRLLAVLLQRLRPSDGNLAAGGIVGFGMSFRAVAVMVVIVALAASDARLALAATAVYALAYTLELGVSLALYFGGGTRETA